MHTLRKTQRTGNGFKERLIIKGFKHADDMNKFLSSQSNNEWTINSEPEYHGSFKPELAALKPGTYAFAGGKYYNVKSLDASILAHI